MEVGSYALLITHDTACDKPSKRSIIGFRIQMTIRVATSLLPTPAYRATLLLRL